MRWVGRALVRVARPPAGSDRGALEVARAASQVARSRTKADPASVMVDWNDVRDQGELNIELHVPIPREGRARVRTYFSLKAGYPSGSTSSTSNWNTLSTLPSAFFTFTCSVPETFTRPAQYGTFCPSFTFE